MKEVRFARELVLGMLMLALLAASTPAAMPKISIEGAWGVYPDCAGTGPRATGDRVQGCRGRV